MTILNNFTAVYGADAVAAMGIAYKIYMVPMQITLGFSQGIMPLVSYNFASGNRRRMKDTILFALKLMVPILAVVMLLYHFGAGTLIRLFMNNNAIVAYGEKFLQGFGLGLIFLCVDFLAVGVFQALGPGKIFPVFCSNAEDRSGNPCPFHPELSVSALRTGLCPVHRRAVPGGLRDYHAETYL